jgi:hypothetical protein
MWHRAIFKSLAALAETADGLQIVELRTMVGAARRIGCLEKSGLGSR